MPSTPLEIAKLEDSASGRALQATSQAPTADFVKFTSDLVANVFHTLTDTLMTQTRTYADLVASVAGTLEDFESKTLGDPNEAAAHYLLDVVLPTYQGTATPPLTMPLPTTITGTTTFQNTDVTQVYAGVTTTIGTTETTFALDATNSIATADLLTFTVALLKRQAKRTYDDLKSIIAMGVEYIDVDHGTIKTSLTFHTDATDSATVSTTNTSSSFDTANRTFAGNLARRSSTSFGGKIAGFFLGRSMATSIGGGFSTSRSTSNISVTVVNENQKAVTNLSTDITGSLSLDFSTKHFPSITG